MPLPNAAVDGALDGALGPPLRPQPLHAEAVDLLRVGEGQTDGASAIDTVLVSEAPEHAVAPFFGGEVLHVGTDGADVTGTRSVEQLCLATRRPETLLDGAVDLAVLTQVLVVEPALLAQALGREANRSFEVDGAFTDQRAPQRDFLRWLGEIEQAPDPAQHLGGEHAANARHLAAKHRTRRLARQLRELFIGDSPRLGAQAREQLPEVARKVRRGRAQERPRSPRAGQGLAIERTARQGNAGFDSTDEPQEVAAGLRGLGKRPEAASFLQLLQKRLVGVPESARVHRTETVQMVEDEVPESFVLVPLRRFDGDVIPLAPVEPLRENAPRSLRVDDHLQTGGNALRFSSVAEHDGLGT